MAGKTKKPRPARSAAARKAAPALEIEASPGFAGWLSAHTLSLAFTTYQAGKLFLIGVQADGRLSLFERTFNRCMGLCSGPRGELYMSTLYQLWCLENALDPGVSHQGYDRVYVPRLAYTTGDLDIHDIAIERTGRLVFVNTLFSCLARPDPRCSFVPLWTPSFISALAAEDRCHLNGLALENGAVRYASALAASDEAGGWRGMRRDGGIVIDVPSGAVAGRGLSMPHSPRLREGRLWLLDSGTGFLGALDPAKAVFEPVAFCPGYLRGLAFAGGFAVCGLSRPRENRTFSGLALDDNLSHYKTEPFCGLVVIDLERGALAHWLRLEGVVQELYDVIALPGVSRPMALGFAGDEIQRVITLGAAETV